MDLNGRTHCQPLRSCAVLSDETAPLAVSHRLNAPTHGQDRPASRETRVYSSRGWSYSRPATRRGARTGQRLRFGRATAARWAAPATVGLVLGLASMAHLTLPDPAPPELTLPELALPELTLPELSLPAVTLPEVTLP